MLCLAFVMLTRLFIAALWSPAWKGLTSKFLFVMFHFVFVTFPCDILGQVWSLLYQFLIFSSYLTLITEEYHSYMLFKCHCKLMLSYRFVKNSA